MPFTEKRPFSLLYRHHASFLQGTTNSAWRERLVDNVGKWFGELGSIFQPSSIDKMFSIVYISMRKLGRVTPRDFWREERCFLWILEIVLEITPAELAA